MHTLAFELVRIETYGSRTLVEEASLHFITAPPSVPITAEVTCRPSVKNETDVHPACRSHGGGLP